jgi:hypothetical protein
MAQVIESGGWYIVRLDGEDLGKFIHLLDANCFALQLLDRGMATTVTLVSGLVICA